MKKSLSHFKKKTSLILFAAFFVVAIVAGCSHQEKTSEADVKTVAEKNTIKEYKIGAILSVTGNASYLGDPEKKTLDLLTDRVNAAGGINGVPIKMIIEDDSGLEGNTKMAAVKLVDKEGVLAIIGPSRSGTTMAIKDFMNEKQVPLISCAAAEAIVNPVYKWVFKTPQKDSFVVQHILKYMKENNITKIAVLYANTGFGQEGLRQIKESTAGYGVQILFEGAYQPAATEEELTTLLTGVKEMRDVQAIVNWSILPAQSIIPRKMKDLKMDDIVLFHSHGFGNKKYVEKAGDAANGIIFPAGRLLVAEKLPDGHPQKAVLVQYKNDYENRYKEDASTFGGQAYDAFWIVVKAIETARSDDREAIRAAIENMSGFAGTGGIFNFSAQDHNGLDMTSLEILTVRNGSFTLLAR